MLLVVLLCVCLSPSRTNADRSLTSGIKELLADLMVEDAFAAKDASIACRDAEREASFCKEWKDLGSCTDHKEVMQLYCEFTCGCKARAPPIPEVPACARTKYGCCWDNVTVVDDESKDNCPPCFDTMSSAFCTNWKMDCNSKIPKQGEYMRYHCPTTCGVACDTNMNVNKKCEDMKVHQQDCLLWFQDGMCESHGKQMKDLCPYTCGFC